MDDTEEQTNNRPWLYKKGQSGNPGGRPVGSVSMKTYVRNKLLSMTEEEREEFLEGVDKKVLWEMAEGKPEAKTEVTGKDGEPLKVTVDADALLSLLNDKGRSD